LVWLIRPVWPSRPGSGPVIAVVMAMPMVHEEVHQRTGQQQQIRQRAEDMGTVFSEQEIRGNGAQHEQADGVARTPEAPGFNVMVMVHLFLRK
jgi:hypothetical protein